MYLTPASTGCSKVFKSFVTAMHVHNPLNTEYWPHFHTSIEETVDLSGTVSLEPSALKTPPGEIVADQSSKLGQMVTTRNLAAIYTLSRVFLMGYIKKISIVKFRKQYLA